LTGRTATLQATFRQLNAPTVMSPTAINIGPTG